MSYSWTLEQEAIFEWFEGGGGHLVVVARAGTTKTTTALQGIDRAEGARNIILCAFNRAIADELSGRLRNPMAKAMTLHSIGNRIVHRRWPGVRVEQKEQRGQRARYLSVSVAPDAPDPILRLISKLHSFAREMTPFAAGGGELLDLAWEKECVPAEEWESRGWTDVEVCNAAWRAMQLAREPTSLIDFADQIFLPLANDWALPTYDLTVIDEAQDLGPAQIVLARRVTSGRLCVIGDDRQSIYGFRGADSQVLTRLTTELDASVLRLTQTFRCGRAIVKLAQAIVPDIVAAPSAGDGEVSRLPLPSLLEAVEPGDVILSRLNAPLVGLCLKLLRAGVSARVEGKDLAAGIRALIRDLAVGIARTSVDALLVQLAEWERRELQRALATANEDTAESRTDSIHERAEAIRVLAEGADEVSLLLARLDQIFSGTVEEAGACVVLSSIHRAKGREWDNVFILEQTLRDSSLDERNIRYVAITRARRRLIMVYDPSLKASESRAAKGLGSRSSLSRAGGDALPEGPREATASLQGLPWQGGVVDDPDDDPFASMVLGAVDR